jgi:hypothetical protein
MTLNSPCALTSFQVLDWVFYDRIHFYDPYEFMTLMSL